MLCILETHGVSREYLHGLLVEIVFETGRLPAANFHLDHLESDYGIDKGVVVAARTFRNLG